MSYDAIQERQHGARRRALAAAHKVLRDHSYGSFSVERVARAAGLSRRTLYNQFGGRDELYRIVRLELMAEVEAVLPREIGRGVPLRQAIEAFVRAACAALAGNAHVQLRAAVIRDGSELSWLPTLYRERIVQPLEWAVERCLLQQEHDHALAVDEPAGQAQRLVAMIMATVAEPSAFHPGEIAEIFLNRLKLLQPGGRQARGFVPARHAN